MEIIAKNESVGAVNETLYCDKKNEQKVFRSIGVTLRTGKDVIYAEAVQEQANILLTDQSVRAGNSYFVRLMFYKREYTDQQGVVRYDNDVRLLSWEPMF